MINDCLLYKSYQHFYHPIFFGWNDMSDDKVQGDESWEEHHHFEVPVPSGNLLQFAIEHGHGNVVSFPIENLLIFHGYATVYQR